MSLNLGRAELALGHWGSKTFKAYIRAIFSDLQSLIPRGFKENQKSKARVPNLCTPSENLLKL